MSFLAQHIEALIFCAPKPIGKVEIHECLKEMFDANIPIEDVSGGIAEVKKRFQSDDNSFELINEFRAMNSTRVCDEAAIF